MKSLKSSMDPPGTCTQTNHTPRSTVDSTLALSLSLSSTSSIKSISDPSPSPLSPLEVGMALWSLHPHLLHLSSHRNTAVQEPPLCSTPPRSLLGSSCSSRPACTQTPGTGATFRSKRPCPLAVTSPTEKLSHKRLARAGTRGDFTLQQPMEASSKGTSPPLYHMGKPSASMGIQSPQNPQMPQRTAVSGLRRTPTPRALDLNQIGEGEGPETTVGMQASGEGDWGVGSLPAASYMLLYKCHKCGKAFAKPQSLGGHMRSHQLHKGVQSRPSDPSTAKLVTLPSIQSTSMGPPPVTSAPPASALVPTPSLPGLPNAPLPPLSPLSPLAPGMRNLATLSSTLAAALQSEEQVASVPVGGRIAPPPVHVAADTSLASKHSATEVDLGFPVPVPGCRIMARRTGVQMHTRVL